MDRVLVYDGGCGICSFAAGLVGALDRWGRVRRVSLRDPESRRLLAAMDEDARWSSFHFLADGKTTSRGEGVLELLGALPLGGGIPRLAADAPALRRASERAYSLVHAIRNRFQCAV